ncbi:FtsX-like permease family protein [Streptomyces endophyticus]|uniref:ABC transporter permease n=1 Tax=Streptomyces endophyticus TaxID=714166 RepID=A0ABU6F7S4_9ACTN|nr:FtsX-like permease family protein [Streptomyces endophyticus]MEB8340034.1 ABC transporter permease [Streptomyces endophyticus]
MTLLDDRPAQAPPAPAEPGLAGRLRDLALGVRFGFSGGREGWIRTLLTALGVGLGVAVLLGAASVPNFTSGRDARYDARSIDFSEESVKPSDRTLLTLDTSSSYRDVSVGGFMLSADGEHPVLPPGVDKLPGPGEMLVSPALRDLLDSPEGELLKKRYDFRDVGTIHEAGLSDPFDLYMYAGSDSLSTDRGATRVDGFGRAGNDNPLDPALVLMILLGCVVLLAPIAIFIATAVRFGGERRDRRLAALRLVGADARMTRWVAAGEALFGTLVGLAFGLVAFFAGRQVFAHVEVWRLSAFPDDFTPVPVLAAVVLLAVPLSAIAVTVFALRSVAIEPLGVVRGGRVRGRRLWWRLPVPVIGVLVLFLSSFGEGSSQMDMAVIAGGVLLTLVGMVLVLPWLVESVVSRLRGGSVPWQLATRRLQLNSSAATRAISGITIAVAGGIALQMFTVGINDSFNSSTGQDPKRAQIGANTDFPSGALADRMVQEFRTTKGVRKVIGTVSTSAERVGAKPGADGYAPSVSLSVGSCPSLRELAHLPSCSDGDVFRVTRSHDSYLDGELEKVAVPGGRLVVDNPEDAGRTGLKPVHWKLPGDVRTVDSRKDPAGEYYGGILATPGALDPATLHTASTSAQIQIDESVPDAADQVRNTAFAVDPGMHVWTYELATRDKEYASIRTALFTAAALTMVIIAASMLVSQIEQLRERRRLLSVLVAYGTKRSTLAWSVLWQTAIPVVLGMAMAVTGGLTLGWLMLRLVGKPVTDWLLFLPLSGVAAALIAVVTLLSLPPLYRMMRAEGLRTE